MRDATIGQVVRYGPKETELMRIYAIADGEEIQPEGYRGHDFRGASVFAISTDCELATHEELALWEKIVS